MPATWQITHSEEFLLSKEPFSVHLHYRGHGLDFMCFLWKYSFIYILIMIKMLVIDPSHHNI